MRPSRLKFTVLAALLAAALLCGLPGAASADGSSLPGPLTDNPNVHPCPVVDAKYYSILIDKQAELLTVFRRDGSGRYTIIDRQFVCSTGRTSGRTPVGTFKIGQKYRWIGSRAPYNEYMQFAFRIRDYIMIHSVPYTRPDPNKLLREGYQDLGKPVSAGCIRLTTRDAKWLYANCPTGTVVKVVAKGGPAAVCVAPVPPLPDGATYDPTDTSSGH